MSESKEEKRSEYFDSEFERVIRRINERESGTKRNNQSNKFNLSLSTANHTFHSGKDGNTYIDELGKYLANKGVSQMTISALHSFVLCQEFDSEAIVHDLCDAKHSNLAFALNHSQKCLDLMRKFIKN
ncbi:MAG: hypothetical protein GY938_00645, partial [Ketobacter sp.]|nr:hypothetical protein [Ketobacter sp.]